MTKRLWHQMSKDTDIEAARTPTLKLRVIRNVFQAHLCLYFFLQDSQFSPLNGLSRIAADNLLEIKEVCRRVVESPVLRSHIAKCSGQPLETVRLALDY